MTDREPIQVEFPREEELTRIATDLVDEHSLIADADDSHTAVTLYGESIAKRFTGLFVGTADLNPQEVALFHRIATVFFVQDCNRKAFLPNNGAKSDRTQFVRQIENSIRIIFPEMLEFFYRYERYFTDVYEEPAMLDRIRTEQGVVYQAVVHALEDIEGKHDRKIQVSTRRKTPTTHKLIPTAHRLLNQVFDIADQRETSIEERIPVMQTAIADKLVEMLEQYSSRNSDKDKRAFHAIAMMYLETEGLEALKHFVPANPEEIDPATIAFAAQNFAFLYDRLVYAYNDYCYLLRSAVTRYRIEQEGNPSAERQINRQRGRTQDRVKGLVGLGNELGRLGLKKSVFWERMPQQARVVKEAWCHPRAIKGPTGPDWPDFPPRG